MFFTYFGKGGLHRLMCILNISVTEYGAAPYFEAHAQTKTPPFRGGQWIHDRRRNEKLLRRPHPCCDRCP